MLPRLAKVVDARWAAPRWPVAWGGRGLDDAQARIIERVRRRLLGTGQDRTNPWATPCWRAGTGALKAKLVGPLLRGEVAMCLLYSEPGAGSDLAGIRTRADRQGDEAIVNGQVWTSGAAMPTTACLIARTDWDVFQAQGHQLLLLPDEAVEGGGAVVAPDHQRVATSP